MFLFFCFRPPAASKRAAAGSHFRPPRLRPQAKSSGLGDSLQAGHRFTQVGTLKQVRRSGFLKRRSVFTQPHGDPINAHTKVREVHLPHPENFSTGNAAAIINQQHDGITVKSA